MKQSKGFFLLLCTAILLFSLSCNESSTSTSSSTDTTTVIDSETVDTASSQVPSTTSNINTTPEDILITRYKISDYNKWRAMYDTRDSLRSAHGLHNYVIGRGVQDTNMIMVAVKSDDLAKARAFTQSAALKSAMQKGYIVGTPKFNFTKVYYQDMSPNMSELRAMNFLTVKDWDAWKQSFEAGRQIRIDNGLADRAYGHEADDNRKVVLVLGITDTAKANAHWNSDLLKQKRKESGVVGDVERFVYRVVQKY